MSECWAAGLEDCAGKISREHIVTKGIFAGDEVFVHGFPWCREAPVKIGLAGLTAKILCAKHNSELSSADNAAIQAVENFREFFRLADVRTKLGQKKRWRIVRLTSDGYELERWFLKTLTNVAFGREYPVFKPKYEWQPSQELVEIAFGRKRFRPRAGLYLLGGGVGDNINTNEKLSIMTFTNDADEFTGARFSIFGFLFALYLKEEGLNRIYRSLTQRVKPRPPRTSCIIREPSGTQLHPINRCPTSCKSIGVKLRLCSCGRLSDRPPRRIRRPKTLFVFFEQDIHERGCSRLWGNGTQYHLGATISSLLCTFFFVRIPIGGYPFYGPVERFCIGVGFLAALLGLGAAAAGKGKLRLAVALVSTLNVFLCYVAAVSP